jgi:hypothetical protein
MPTVSKQLDILRALTTHLEGITTDNGYAYDLDGRVFRGRAQFGDDIPLPCLSIIEAPRPDEQPVVGGHERAYWSEDWTLLVQGWVEDDKINPTDPAYELKAAVEHRLSSILAIRNDRGTPLDPTAYRLGNRVSHIAIGPGMVSPPRPNISAKAFFYLPVVLKIAVSTTAPYVTTS